MNHFPSNTLFKSINKTNPSSQQQHNSQHNKISGPSLLCSPLSTTPHQTLLPNPNFQERPLHLFHPNPFKLTAPHIFTSFPTGFSKKSDCHFYPYAFLKAMNFRSLEEFWAFYVNQHSRPSTRRWHFVGTLFGIFFLICSVFFRWWLLFFVPFSGYGCAWYSHFFVEGNVPATFGHPFWSLLCDFKMFGLMLTGKMDREIKRLGKRPVLQVF